MSLDKTRDARVAGVTNQNSTARMLLGDSSGGTFTKITNQLRGTLMWDDMMYVLQGVSVAGGATGGSYTITIQSDAVRDNLVGYTGMPIAQAVIGPLTKATVILDNMFKGTASPLPTHIFINQTAAGGGIWFQLSAVARQYRGYMGSPASATAERIIQGNLLRGASYGGGPFTDGKGIAASTTFTLGTSGTAMGLHRMRAWDHACLWVVAGNSLTGTHDVALVAKIGGTTVTVATTGTTGNLSAAGQKLPLINQFYGVIPNPTQIIWTVVSAGGVSDARVVVMAKSGRGSLAKD